MNWLKELTPGRRAALACHGILAGEQRGDVGGEDLRAVGASALHGVEESEAQGSGRGSGGRVLRQRALAQGQTQPHNQRKCAALEDSSIEAGRMNGG